METKEKQHAMLWGGPKEINDLKTNKAAFSISPVLNSPQTMSNVHSVTYGKMLNESLFSSVDSFRTRIALCSLKMSMKSSRILKWNAGVKIYFWKRHKKVRQIVFTSFICCVDLDGRLPFAASAISVRSSLAVPCRAKGGDTSSRGSYRCASDYSKSAVKGSQTMQWEIMIFHDFGQVHHDQQFHGQQPR